METLAPAPPCPQTQTRTRAAARQHARSRRDDVAAPTAPSLRLTAGERPKGHPDCRTPALASLASLNLAGVDRRLLGWPSAHPKMNGPVRNASSVMLGESAR